MNRWVYFNCETTKMKLAKKHKKMGLFSKKGFKKCNILSNTYVSYVFENYLYFFPSFFRELQLITVLLLICDSYMSWSIRFVSLKLCVGCSMTLNVTLNVIIPYRIKIVEKPHTLFLPDLWYLCCNKKFYNLITAAWVVKAPQNLTWRQIF